MIFGMLLRLVLLAGLLAATATAQKGPVAPDDGNPLECPAKEATANGGFGVAKACGFRKILSSPPTLVEPPEIHGVVNGTANPVALSVEMGTLDATAFSFKSRLFCFTPENGTKTCNPIGPTLRINPGESMTVTLSNGLGAESGQGGKVLNDLRHPNHVNMHTHGLHIDPSVDNVFLTVAPEADAKVYKYQIESNHMAGTHWYHSHGADNC
jgi:FtsP/CotA-like multicopper oxidase with cupredoxin domain